MYIFYKFTVFFILPYPLLLHIYMFLQSLFGAFFRICSYGINSYLPISFLILLLAWVFMSRHSLHQLFLYWCYFSHPVSVQIHISPSSIYFHTFYLTCCCIPLLSAAATTQFLPPGSLKFHLFAVATNYACAHGSARRLPGACALTNPQEQQQRLSQSVSQSVDNASLVIRASIYIPFLKLATFSFAIPPPISVSVRSRQAGTETEREPSAMEALGPGKKKIEKEARSAASGEESDPCVGSVCANASLHSWPRMQWGLEALGEKQTESRAEAQPVWHNIYPESKPRSQPGTFLVM